MSIAATELVLYINNTPKLSDAKDKAHAAMARKKRSGDYERDVGIKAFRRVADAAAKAYAKQHKLAETWSRAFSTCDRDDAATELERDFRDLEKAALLEHLLPEKMRRAKGGAKRTPWRAEQAVWFFTGGHWLAATVRSVSPKGSVSLLLNKTGQKRSVRADSPKLSKTRKALKEAVQKKIGTYTSTRRTRACPVGTRVQTLVFDRQLFSPEDAKQWALRNGYTAGKVDTTAASHRLRQADPKKFQAGSFRTINLGAVQAVIGCPK